MTKRQKPLSISVHPLVFGLLVAASIVGLIMIAVAAFVSIRAQRERSHILSRHIIEKREWNDRYREVVRAVDDISIEFAELRGVLNIRRSKR